MTFDLNRPRPPSSWRRLIRTRTRRLSARIRRRDPARYRQTLREIAELAVHALAQHDADRPS